MADIHNPRVIGDMVLTRPPSKPEHPVRKEDLDQVVAGIAAQRALYITDITPTSGGIVAEKTFAPTVPADSILTGATADVENVRVHFIAQGALFTPPPVTVNEVEASNFTHITGDLFSGYVDIVLTETGPVEIVSGENTASVHMVLATIGPAVSMLTIGALPGAQTEVKHNDVVAFTGIVTNEATSITVLDKGAARAGSGIVFGAANSAGLGLKTFTGNFTTSNRSGALSLSVVAYNSMGTAGDEAASVAPVTVSQLAPTIGSIAVTYPEGKGALINGDSATVASNITNADSVTYTTTADADIDLPNEYAASKQFTLNSGDYNYATNNFTITAVRAANGATASRSQVVRIANSAPTIQSLIVVGTPARLRSSATGETYTMRLITSQQLSGAPDVEIDKGEWVGDWSVSGTTFTRQFRITDADAKGPMFVGAEFYNIGGVFGSGNQTFTVGGFLLRTLTVPALSRIVEIGTAIADISKVRVMYAGTTSLLTLRNDTESAQASFSIVNAEGEYDAQGTHLWLSDADYAGANTSGTLQVTIEEIV